MLLKVHTYIHVHVALCRHVHVYRCTYVGSYSIPCHNLLQPLVCIYMYMYCMCYIVAIQCGMECLGPILHFTWSGTAHCAIRKWVYMLCIDFSWWYFAMSFTFESTKLLATSTSAIEWYKSRAHILFLSKDLLKHVCANSMWMRYSTNNEYVERRGCNEELCNQYHCIIMCMCTLLHYESHCMCLLYYVCIYNVQ